MNSLMPIKIALSLLCKNLVSPTLLYNNCKLMQRNAEKGLQPHNVVDGSLDGRGLGNICDNHKHSQFEYIMNIKEYTLTPKQPLAKSKMQTDWLSTANILNTVAHSFLSHYFVVALLFALGYLGVH